MLSGLEDKGKECNKLLVTRQQNSVIKQLQIHTPTALLY